MCRWSVLPDRQKFGAEEAAEVGLVTIAADDVDATGTSLTTAIGKASPQGLAASKALTTAPILAAFDDGADEIVEQLAALFASDEAREGMLAFLTAPAPLGRPNRTRTRRQA